MRGRRLLGYRDAVAILTGDGAGLAAADRALGGALNLATGGVSDAVLHVLDARGRILRLGRDLTAGLRSGLTGTDRATRTERIAAAHTVLVVTAYFDALGEVELPFRLAELELTRDEQITVFDGSAGGSLFEIMLPIAPSHPSPDLPYESVLRDLETAYERATHRLQLFLAGLAVWERLDPARRTAATAALADGPLPRLAVERYEELYAQLALEVPEFGFWSGQAEHRATRVVVRRALTGIETALAGLTAAASLHRAAAALATGYRAALPRAILSEGRAPSGVCMPTLGEGYVDPDFRVRAVAEEAHGPAEEGWWEPAPLRSDLTEYLAGVLTTVASTTAPLVVLGQPGAGKSVLTRILAARLPEGGFLPVRVVLREVPADLDIQDQIEHAVRTATGERITWPELVRSAPGAVPVLLLDGFDELLQATGVSQSDFLMRVASFQEREADQGRPVYALVTSRTAVADRARYPDGSVALRLEPFSRPQIERWLDLWNRLNEPSLTGRGLRPLPAHVANGHQALASQPLLLLMLALYDGADNALQRGTGGGEPLGEAELYEELLTSFAVREVRRSAPECTNAELRERADEELQRLSLISFGMFNRRRQWITSAEAEADLTALIGRPDPVQDGFRAPLGQGQLVLGRFFFVQRAQAIREEQRLTTYEFLHATFGEYLVARLAVRLLGALLDQRPALSVGRASVDDDLLYVLLSYAPLSSRQILRFVHARITLLPTDERRRLGELLITAMADHRNRTEHRYTDYRPAVRATSSRHGIYSANLLMLTLQVTGGVTAGELFPGAEKPPALWHRRALLWRAAFTEPEWMDFAMALDVRRVWSGERQDLDIRPAVLGIARSVDVHWLYGARANDEAIARGFSWVRPNPDQIRHKMAVSGGTDDTIVLHIADPFFSWLAPAVTTFVDTPHYAGTSVAHGLAALWLASSLRSSAAAVVGPSPDVVALYRHCTAFVGTPGLDGPTRYRVIRLILGQLVTDAARLPADVVYDLLAAMNPLDLDGECLELRTRAALSALGQRGEAGSHWAVARAYVDDLARTHPARLLSIWSPEQYPEAARRLILFQAIAQVLESGSEDALRGVPPHVLAQARRFAADGRPAGDPDPGRGP
ncbi:NACHT domain-containing protein [Streptomyces sp. NPDC055078]